MSLFDRAWALVKMPLVRDSIEYGEPDYTGFPTATAIFQDRNDPSIQFPMEAYEYQGGTKVRVTDPSDKYAAAGYFRTGYGPDFEDTTTSDIHTLQSQRRKGLATAVYDLINEMGKTKGVRLKTQARNLSGDSAPLWAKVLGLPYEGDEHASAHAKFQQDNREPFYYPEEGVYE